jgi:hypothetical protein
VQEKTGKKAGKRKTGRRRRRRSESNELTEGGMLRKQKPNHSSSFRSSPPPSPTEQKTQCFEKLLPEFTYSPEMPLLQNPETSLEK